MSFQGSSVQVGHKNRSTPGIRAKKNGGMVIRQQPQQVGQSNVRTVYIESPAQQQQQVQTLQYKQPMSNADFVIVSKSASSNGSTPWYQQPATPNPQPAQVIREVVVERQDIVQVEQPRRNRRPSPSSYEENSGLASQSNKKQFNPHSSPTRTVTFVTTEHQEHQNYHHQQQQQQFVEPRNEFQQQQQQGQYYQQPSQGGGQQQYQLSRPQHSWRSSSVGYPSESSSRPVTFPTLLNQSPFDDYMEREIFPNFVEQYEKSNFAGYPVDRSLITPACVGAMRRILIITNPSVFEKQRWTNGEVIESIQLAIGSEESFNHHLFFSRSAKCMYIVLDLVDSPAYNNLIMNGCPLQSSVRANVASGDRIFFTHCTFYLTVADSFSDGLTLCLQRYPPPGQSLIDCAKEAFGTATDLLDMWKFSNTRNTNHRDDVIPIVKGLSLKLFSTYVRLDLTTDSPLSSALIHCMISSVLKGGLSPQHLITKIVPSKFSPSVEKYLRSYTPWEVSQWTKTRDSYFPSCVLSIETDVRERINDEMWRRCLKNLPAHVLSRLLTVKRPSVEKKSHLEKKSPLRSNTGRDSHLASEDSGRVSSEVMSKSPPSSTSHKQSREKFNDESREHGSNHSPRLQHQQTGLPSSLQVSTDLQRHSDHVGEDSVPIVSMDETLPAGDFQHESEEHVCDEHAINDENRYGDKFGGADELKLLLSEINEHYDSPPSSLASSGDAVLESSGTEHGEGADDDEDYANSFDYTHH